MVAIYITLIQRGLWTLDQVPERWREDVKKALEEQGGN